MGYYINPSDCSKEAFLKQHGEPLIDPKEFDFSSDRLPVCWVDNGPFTAAGIAYDPHERDAFLRPDPRQKRWYSVSREALKPFYPGA